MRKWWQPLYRAGGGDRLPRTQRQVSEWSVLSKRGETVMRRTKSNTTPKQQPPPSSGELTVLLCDDHPLFLIGLKTFLSQRDGIKVVGEATEPETLLRLATRLQPNIVIMDMSTAKRNAFTIFHQLAAFCPDTKVIIITGYCDPVDLLRSIRAGAQGFMFKSSDPNLLLNAIATIRDGKPWVQREFTEHLFDVITDLSQAASVPPIQTLSLREREILRLVAEGLSNKEIAKQLHISVQTVKVYLTRIFHKLGVRNRVEAAQYALFHLSEWAD